MANANPTEFSGRPKNWYAPRPEQPGLSPVRLKMQANPTSMEFWSCECGQRNCANDGVKSPCTACGAEQSPRGK
jgi:hypothetical protein